MKLAATLLQQSAVRDLVSERVFERVLEIWVEPGLVEELGGGLQVVWTAFGGQLTVLAYKPHRLVFQRALEQLGVQLHEVMHVGDSAVDDVKGAKAAGLQVAWVNRDGRSRRPDVPSPDFEIRDLTQLPALL